MSQLHTFGVAKAVDEMVDGQASCLHEGEGDHWPNQPKPSSDQVLANGLCFGGPQWHALLVLVFAHHGRVVQEPPYVAAK